MSKIAPLAEEVLDIFMANETDDLIEVYEEFSNDWRHGGTQTQVIHRRSDNTYWQYCYRVSTDGEYNGLRDNDYNVFEVEPKEVTAITYIPVKE